MNLIRRIKNIKAINKVLTFAIGGILYLLSLPIRLLFPRQKKSMLLFGTANGLFIDNVKYFFLHLKESQTDYDFYFVSSNPEVYQNLKKHFENVLYYPSAKCIWKMLRAGVFVYDNTVLDQKFRFAFAKGARHIQLWHGAGIKKFWNENPALGTRLLRPYFNFTEKKRVFDAFISTSDFFSQNYFRPAFQARQFPVTGYPRNKILWQNAPASELQLLETDTACLDRIAAHKALGDKIIIYVPTFRGIRGKGNNALAFDLQRLNQFAREQALLFVFKLHPVLSQENQTEDYDRIVWHRSDKDVYPVLRESDLMISDYSSIFIDFLILNRPILFYMYDQQEYQEKDRELVSFYPEFMLGSISQNQSELEQHIMESFTTLDTDSQKRKNALQKAFEYQDGKASQRIEQYIKALK